MRNRENPEALLAAAPPAETITIELLAKGAHACPSDGANVLELAAVLAGEPWSTCPESVHPALAAAAQAVNDLLDDDHRRLLVPLAPWLPGTRAADAGTWAAVVGICDRAAITAARDTGLPVPPRIDGKAVPEGPGQAGSPPGKRGHGTWAHRQDRRKITDAIRSAQLSWAGSGSERTAEALCQLLTDCINECRRLAGEQPVNPRLPLADCPPRLLVQQRSMWSPGCDWMSIGYQPVAGLMPACLRGKTPGAHEAAPT